MPHLLREQHRAVRRKVHAKRIPVERLHLGDRGIAAPIPPLQLRIIRNPAHVFRLAPLALAGEAFFIGVAFHLHVFPEWAVQEEHVNASILHHQLGVMPQLAQARG